MRAFLAVFVVNVCVAEILHTWSVTSGADVAPLRGGNWDQQDFFTTANHTVLVLGSGGLLGSALVHQLRQTADLNILEVKNRHHIDLRNSTAFYDVFANVGIDFIFFLACEVGGSKFLEAHDETVQQQIIRHNAQMYETVFPFAAKRRIPLLFTSSHLQFSQSGAYGAIKRLGEEWVRTLEYAKSVRLWNVYGYEKVNLKSRVISDWVSQCASSGVITSRTTATERRQFLHADDAAAAMIGIYNNFDAIPEQTLDIASGVWTRLEDLGAIISAAFEKHTGVRCKFEASRKAAVHAHEVEPRTCCDNVLRNPFVQVSVQ